MAKLLWAERHLFMIIKNIADGVRLVNIKTDKFKTSRITFTMASPLCGNISAKALLPYLLSRRCAKYPDFTEFKGVLDSLYGAAVSAGVSALSAAGAPVSALIRELFSSAADESVPDGTGEVSVIADSPTAAAAFSALRVMSSIMVPLRDVHAFMKVRYRITKKRTQLLKRFSPMPLR